MGTQSHTPQCLANFCSWRDSLGAFNVMLLSLSLCLSLNSGRRQTDILYLGHRRLPQESGVS